MDQYISLADGTRIENAHILEMDAASIIVYVKGGKDMEWMFDIFDDPDLTAEIRANRYGNEKTYTGYTNLFALRIENTDLSTACLRKSH